MQNMENPNMTYHQKEKESVGSPPTINYGEDFKISDAPQNMVVITGTNGKEMMVDKNILEDLLDENQAQKDEASRNKIVLDFLTNILAKKKEKESNSISHSKTQRASDNFTNTNGGYSNQQGFNGTGIHSNQQGFNGTAVSGNRISQSHKNHQIQSSKTFSNKNNQNHRQQDLNQVDWNSHHYRSADHKIDSNIMPMLNQNFVNRQEGYDLSLIHI